MEGFFDQAYRKANSYLPDCNVVSCKDIGDALVFALNQKDTDTLLPGLPMVGVMKSTGELFEITIPPIENLDRLKRAKDIPIP